MRFEDDHEAAAFVLWAEEQYGLHRSVAVEAQEQSDRLKDLGWTRHGYCDHTWCPPGEIYDEQWGVCSPDNPRVIAGRWICTCGFKTDRLAWANGHAEMGRTEPEKLSGPLIIDHIVTEIERRGPENREWGD